MSVIVRLVRAVTRRIRPTIATRNLAELKDLLRSGEDLVLVASYPRSGNTWIRYILADCFLQNAGFRTSTDLPIHPDKVIPALNSNPLCERDPRACPPALFIKIHERYDELDERVGVEIMAKSRCIYLFRDPADALVSYYHFHRRYPHLHSKADAGIDTFCLDLVPEWIDHAENYVRASRGDTDRFHFISYESLLSDTFAVMSGLFRFLDVRMDSEVIEHAIRNMAFKKLHDQEALEPQNREEFFFRKGVRGSAFKELHPLTNTKIDEVTGKIHAQLSSIASDHARRTYPDGQT